MKQISYWRKAMLLLAAGCTFSAAYPQHTFTLGAEYRPRAEVSNPSYPGVHRGVVRHRLPLDVAVGHDRDGHAGTDAEAQRIVAQLPKKGKRQTLRKPTHLPSEVISSLFLPSQKAFIPLPPPHPKHRPRSR